MKMSMSSNKKDIETNLFCAGYALFLIGQILGHTFFPIPSIIRYMFIFLGIGLIVLKMALYDSVNLNVSSIFKIIFSIVFLVVSIISAKQSQSPILVIVWVLVIGARNIDFDKALKTFIIISVSILIITILAYFLGFINESSAVRGGNIRHSFGYRYPTDFVAMIAYIFMADLYMCIKKNSPIYNRIFMYIVVGLFTIFECDSRLGSGTIFILIPVIIFLKYKKSVLQNRAIKFIMRNAFFICSLTSILLVQSYINNPNSGLLVNIDQLTSYRLTFNVIAVKFFGYSLWGQEIYQRYEQMMGNNYFFIDSSYYIFLIQYGIVLMILVGIVFYFSIKKKLNANKMIIPFLFLIICINSLIGQQFYLPEYNVFLLTVFASISPTYIDIDKETKGEKI